MFYKPIFYSSISKVIDSQVLAIGFVLIKPDNDCGNISDILLLFFNQIYDIKHPHCVRFVTLICFYENYFMRLLYKILPNLQKLI